MESRSINFARPSEWLLNSPDAAPCDFYLFGRLKSALNRVHWTEINQLKKAVRLELKKIPLEQIKRALESYPKRCDKINGSNDYHISP